MSGGASRRLGLKPPTQVGARLAPARVPTHVQRLACTTVSDNMSGGGHRTAVMWAPLFAGSVAALP
eukprot:6996973-Alexandrium_andersonii.AAC.1